MVDHAPPVFVRSNNGITTYYTFRNLLYGYESDFSDPLRSAIVQDISRGLTLDLEEVLQAKEKSWTKEIILSQQLHPPSLFNWDVVFSMDDLDKHNQLHPDIPSNYTMANSIHLHLLRLRKRYADKVLYPRSTHKNMSFETRRSFEKYVGPLENPIFGQDDWQRVYHFRGIQLEGATEMRQKWYASGAKPRTYFAMGGDAYSKSRFLQTFFSDLVDSLPMTNHKTRLRPGRLTLPYSPEDSDFHWRIYDLTSFTSSCTSQRSLCYALAKFFFGVPVFCYDELDGPVPYDLGELLYEYTEHCVENPSLSYERYDPSTRDYSSVHTLASMLGIFGNLMTCTLGHGTIASFFTSSMDESNCAGDDELCPEDRLNSFELDRGIRTVGPEFERTKSFRGDEEGAICLKRPFLETPLHPILLDNIIPPTVMTAILNLSEIHDPRYTTFDTLEKREAISLVGKDLMRFLDSAWRKGYQDIGALGSVYHGFSRLVKHLTGWNPKPSLGHVGTGPYWPMDPRDYEFGGPDRPFDVLVTYYMPRDTKAEKREVISDPDEGRFVGDEWEGNSTPRLKLLETLGYIEKVEIIEDVPVPNRLLFWLAYYRQQNPPVVYQYSIIRDIPSVFLSHIQ